MDAARLIYWLKPKVSGTHLLHVWNHVGSQVSTQYSTVCPPGGPLDIAASPDPVESKHNKCRRKTQVSDQLVKHSILQRKRATALLMATLQQPAALQAPLQAALLRRTHRSPS
jgi:hypothetical protein